MSKKTILCYIFIFGFCIIFLTVHLYGISIAEKAQIEQYDKSTLEGLAGIRPPCIVVMPRNLKNSILSFAESNTDEFDEACLALKEELNGEIVSLITRNGIKIIPPQDNQQNNIAWFGIEIAIRKPFSNEPCYAFSIQAKLEQEVLLARNVNIRTCISTWPNDAINQDIIFVQGYANLKEAVKSKVIGQVQLFIEDYLAANSKK